MNVVQVKEVKPNRYYKWQFNNYVDTAIRFISTDNEYVYTVGVLIDQRYLKFAYKHPTVISKFNATTSDIIFKEMSEADFLLETL